MREVVIAALIIGTSIVAAKAAEIYFSDFQSCIRVVQSQGQGVPRERAILACKSM